ncbi:MAG: Coenzyme F420 hydrogenase/dehydrogenase, beta subunit C-terminal domain [Acidimicrobiales bacterium]
MTLSPPRQRAEMSGISEAPGKVWFWELAAAVIDADRCVQCGACVAACPTDSIGIGSDNLPKLVKMCTGCSLCWDFCPRGGMRYEATWWPADTVASSSPAATPEASATWDTVASPSGVAASPAPSSGVPAFAGPSAPAEGVRSSAVATASRSVASSSVVTAPKENAGLSAVQVKLSRRPKRAETGQAGGGGPALDDWRITGADPAPGLGLVRQAIAARVLPTSKLETGCAQDGGVVTAILLASLAAGEIDGAVVAREDPDHPWKGVPHLATTAGEIREAAGSFYNQTMALASIDLAAAGLAPDARIALVGTPCEIQGLKALQSRQWRRGSRAVDNVVLTIALLCTKSFDYSKLMLRELRDERQIDLSEVGKVDVIHGRMIVEDHYGERIVDEPVKDFHGAALKGCDECADFLGRAADISVGSVGSGAGYSSVLIRTQAGLQAIDLVRPELEIMDIEAPEALERLDRLDKKIASTTLHRPFQPEGPLFVDFAEHLTFYGGTDRAPVWQD